MAFNHIKTKKEFIARSEQIHNNFYNYSKVKFAPRELLLTQRGESNRKPPEYYREEIITIICPKHGNYQQRARKHLEGHGCHCCALETRSKALWNRSKEACFLEANDFKEFQDHIEIYSTPSDGIPRTILISKEDKEILEWSKWRVTGHQPYRRSRTCYCVARQSNRMVKEGNEWLGSNPKLHRLIMSRVLNRELTKEDLIDHINGNGLDNRRKTYVLVQVVKIMLIQKNYAL